MSDRSRISNTVGKFNDYINNSDDYLQATPAGGMTPNWQRLGLATGDAGDWHTRRQSWVSGIYPPYINPATSTSLVKSDLHIFITDFRTFANPQLDIMAASLAATNDDARILNFKIGHAAGSHRTTPITDQCIADVHQLGGGALVLGFRSDHDSDHHSISEQANSIQISIKVGGEPPVSDGDAGMQYYIITHALHHNNFGLDNVGKKVYFFARFYLTQYPDLAGPWSRLYTDVIS